MQHSRLLLWACIVWWQAWIPAWGADGAVSPDQYAVSTDGRIYFRIAGRGDGPPVVLVSGGPGGSHTSFMPWFSRLEDRVRVVYFDNIGRGRSDRLPPTRQHSVPRDAGDIEVLREALNAPKLVLLGNSYGALPAIEYTLQHPDRVACLVLSAAMHSEQSFQAHIDALNRAMAAQFPEHWDRLQAMAARGVRSGDDAYQAVYGEVADRLYWFDPRNAARRWRSPDPRDRFDPLVYSAFMGPDSERFVGGTLKGYDPRPRMQELMIPTLVITGRRDVVATPSIAAETVKAFASGVARLVIVEESGHRPFIEQTEAYFAAISHFLDTTQACAGSP
jgi:proline iminopeptidase